MIVFGFHPVREALRHRPEEVRRVWVAASRGGRRRDEVERACREAEVALEEAPPAHLDELARGVHNGFVAEVEGGAAGGAGADPDLVVLVEDVQDPRNLGALLRVCEGAGVGRVLIRDRGSSQLNATVAKTSAGASEWLENRAGHQQRSERSPGLQKEGFWVYGAASGGRGAVGDRPHRQGGALRGR